MTVTVKPISEAGRLPTTPEEYRLAWEQSTDIPYGFCWCGCGERTEVWAWSRSDKGRVKGEPKRYLPYHRNHIMHRFAAPIRERFMEKVAAESDGCWTWVAETNDEGYGKFYWDAEEPKTLAHRASWRLFRGPIPQGLHVLHHCDNPPCVRPDHLFLGTPKDNSVDCVNKDRLITPRRLARTAKGERHGMAKLTAPEVEEIRRRYAAGGVGQKRLAAEFGVSQRLIGKIVNGELWRHQGVQGLIDEGGRR